MVAKDFIDLFGKFNYANRVAVEDFGDRLSLFTVVLFLIACIIVSAKQYFLNSISCYIAVKPTGDNYNNYLVDYCWVHGTIPLRADEPMPQTPEAWDEYDQLRRIKLYASIVSANHLGVEDFADRVSLLTVVLLLLCSLVVAAKQYFLEPIACYVSVSPSGTGFDGFLSSYCWVHGTIPLRPGELMPTSDVEWKNYDNLRRINRCGTVVVELGDGGGEDIRRMTSEIPLRCIHPAHFSDQNEQVAHC
ncbi:hypothetical protein PHET_00758 [Paragonimus heterotremus]|uniref:Innexin n=1 Tax=Paragonimus heterotremus TaxID=100268 RepID=A0A8J4T4L8_9TREM|nr:hypothetical protein PHET_00758 [Paragonimus heterotremus]